MDKCEICEKELEYPKNHVVVGFGGMFNFGATFISCNEHSTESYESFRKARDEKNDKSKV